MLVLIAAVLLGLAPFYPQPHQVEKLRMLAEHTCKRSIDMLTCYIVTDQDRPHPDQQK